ncbi:MAG: thiamine-phosphate kinase [Gammaproteobacteria bacterium]|nr:thiamine-phosphate kinase [Gammaproteobacteria bacterium]
MEAFHSGQLLQYIQQVLPLSDSLDNNFPYAAITVDSLLSGVHFPVNTSPELIAHKSLAVNLSDLAAMGAKPQSVTLGLVLPQWDEVWLQQFVAGFHGLQSQWNLQFIACDIQQGPLSITIQAHGGLKNNKRMLRSGAQVDDIIFVTNTIGDAGCALQYYLDQKPVPEKYKDFLEQRLNKPEPQISAGLCLYDIANAAIDISDGLAADLGHILEESQAGAIIDLDLLPASSALSELSTHEQVINYQLSGGDDYELCFTASPDKCNELQKSLLEIQVDFTEIGKITDGFELCYQQNGRNINLDAGGYDHFK